MPVDLHRVDHVAAAVAACYREAETALLHTITTRLAAGLDRTDWQTSRLAAVAALRRQAHAVVTALAWTGDLETRAAAAAGYRAGRHDAVRELAGRVAPSTVAPEQLPGAAERTARQAMQALADAVVGELRPVQAAILPQVDSVYRRTIAGAAARRLAGVATWREAAQAAYTTLVNRGVTGYVDTAGRTWRLHTYAEMAVRTAVSRAALAGLVDEYTARGVRLVSVDDQPRECWRCRPWEHRILALWGLPGRQEVPAAGGGTVEVDVAATLAEALAAGLMHPNCLPGDALVSAPTGVLAADSRWYEGDLVVIDTAAGDRLSITPNHPVLTPKGWVPAGLLEVGAHVLRYGGGVQGVDVAAGPGDQQVPSRIGEVFDALREASTVPPVRVPVAAEQFHGDGFAADVEVVFADGLLPDAVDTEVGEGVDDVPLVVGAAALGALPALGCVTERLSGFGRASDRIVGGLDLGGPLSFGHALPLAAFGGTAVGSVSTIEQGIGDDRLCAVHAAADLGLWYPVEVESDRQVHPFPHSLWGDAPLPQLPVEGDPVDADGGRDLAGRLTGQVSADRVVKVERRRQWSGHVYNLQTRDGWYVASGLVVHNCRHTIRAYLPGRSLLIKAGRTADPAGELAQQRQREIERTLRHWREMHAAALTDTARRRAADRITHWDRVMGEHVTATGVPRLRYREQIGAGVIPPPGQVDALVAQLGVPAQPTLDAA